jgi:glyoxylase-like metal-dependent hydrolase (beta-lactamase superfamily II)
VSDIHRFRLGDFTVLAVLDGRVRRDDLYPRFAVNARREKVEAVAAESGLRFPEYEQFFVPTVIDTGSQLIVFDPGFGERAPAPEFGRFNTLFADAGYNANDVVLVVITHNHPDHIANLTTRAGSPTFPNARIVFGRVDFDYWRRGENIPDFRPSTLALFREICLPLAGRARFVEADEEVVPGITATAAYGHSAGHMAYRVESGGETLVLMGDTIAHFALSLRRPDWHFAMDDDKPAAAATRARLLGMLADGGAMAMGFHMPFPAIGRVERLGDGYRWEPV